jgi:molybdate transport system ATP-binding protein
MVRVAIRHTLSRLVLDATLEAGPGLTAIVGPSGSGKTTVLNAIAGFLRPAHGSITIADEVIVDVARGIWVPPHQRQIGYVFQEPRLFPHLSVRHNLRFPTWFSRNAGTDIFGDIVTMLDLQPLLDRGVTRLSGGEKQRVALGRALLSRPRLLLLDEPLASVDVARRRDVLPYLDRLRHEWKVPVLYVTHTYSEIEGRAERIIALEDGRVTSVQVRCA